MKRATASAAVIAASAGILLGSAGTAAAQEPWDKYPTKEVCQIAGGVLLSSGAARAYDCWQNVHAPASQRWWLYIV